MKIAILTFDGFNELDSLIAYGILNRIQDEDWHVKIASPTPQVQSMNGLVIDSHIGIEGACQSDVVIVGSGMKTRDVVANSELMAKLKLDPSKQLITAQCSGTLILAKLGLVQNLVACTDLTTKSWVEEAGVKVLNQAFFAEDNIATAGGCLASQYLACWIIAKTKGIERAIEALHYVAPVGEKEPYIEAMKTNILRFI